LEITIYFRRTLYSTKCGPNYNIFDVDMSSHHSFEVILSYRYPSMTRSRATARPRDAAVHFDSIEYVSF